MIILIFYFIFILLPTLIALPFIRVSVALAILLGSLLFLWLLDVLIGIQMDFKYGYADSTSKGERDDA